MTTLVAWWSSGAIQCNHKSVGDWVWGVLRGVLLLGGLGSAGGWWALGLDQAVFYGVRFWALEWLVPGLGSEFLGTWTLDPVCASGSSLLINLSL